MLSAIFQVVDTTTKTILMRLQKDTISIQFSGRLVQLFDCSGRMFDLVIMELVHCDGVLCYFRQTLRILFGLTYFRTIRRIACVHGVCRRS